MSSLLNGAGQHNQCGTVRALLDGRTVLIAESQDFRWPDPEVESSKDIDSLIRAMLSLTDNESAG